LAVVRTLQSDVRIAELVRITAAEPGVPVPGIPAQPSVRHRLAARRGGRLHIEKTAAIYTSRDPAVSDPVESARDCLASQPSFAGLRAAHEAEWGRLWTLA